MRFITSLDQAQPITDSVLTIGTFDGVHRGHQHLIGQLVDRARATGRLSGVLTFSPQPRQVLHPELETLYLSAPGERVAEMKRLGLDLLMVIPFTHELAATPAEAFVRTLHDQLGMRELWAGRDFALGKGREGTSAKLSELGARIGFELHRIEPLMDGDSPISSTRIRLLLLAGEVEQAARLLGRPYVFCSPVIRGRKMGRLLGFRTANLSLDPQRVIPANGVYAVWTWVSGERRPGVANIGVRPSFGLTERLLEVHLLDYEGDLYDQELRVEFVTQLRPEFQFPDAEALVAQVHADIEHARTLLAKSSPHERSR